VKREAKRPKALLRAGVPLAALFAVAACRSGERTIFEADGHVLYAWHVRGDEVTGVTRYEAGSVWWPYYATSPGRWYPRPAEVTPEARETAISKTHVSVDDR
jgi:hypothetical protein